MKKFKEIIMIIFSFLGVLATGLFIFRKPVAKNFDKIEAKLAKRKKEIEAYYQKQREEIENKPPEITIEEYYDELDRNKEDEIQTAVDEAMLRAEKYKVKGDQTG